jgi:peptidoglycan/LPS O-acetylase OafA/YrhL
VLHLDPGDGAAALTYTMNFHLGHYRTWTLGHGWSLAVEEQFYLVWPALLLLAGRRRAFWVAVALVAVLPIVRLVERTHGLVPGPVHAWQSFGDALAVGGLLAGYGEQLWSWRPYRAVLTSWPAVLLPVLAALASADFGGHLRLHALVQLSVLNILIALIIHRSVKVPSSFGARLLNWPPIAAIGVLSYSLYLWQEPFFDRDVHMWWTRFPINVCLAVAAAWSSYHLIERPFLRLRQRIDSRLNSRARQTAQPSPLDSAGSGTEEIATAP